MNDLIRRAMQRYLAGRGGRRTLLRLQQGGVTSPQLAQAAGPAPALPAFAEPDPVAALAALRAHQEQQQTVTAGAGGVTDALSARREANPLRAIVRARAALDAGEEVGAKTQARLGETGINRLDLLRVMTPEQRAAASEQALGGLRKLRPRTRSRARSYSY